MKKVAVLLAPGFEEGEAIIIIDILRRLNIQVDMLSCNDALAVTSYHAIMVTADALLRDVASQTWDAVVLPGGPQGSQFLSRDEQVLDFVRRHDEQGKLICPICSAAARVLGGNALLKGRRYACSGDLWQNVGDGTWVDAPVVEDGNLISGKGFGLVFDFAFTVAARLLGDEAPAREHAEHIYYPWPR
ncbi:DJ-1 family glyoxalase III [Entomohabitans teleogrylli]|uniref:DJ-1 family glyoxalase III n=1 Tax=Entomohabitans teleogrylli TaxID=1384589 RepID=UPI00073D983C|nr:DJ-1 family glyoxalase III [Entomohabitans teleogrylli]